MKKITLKAEPRTISGRKVKQLRAKQQLPANIYGKKTDSIAISLSQDAFNKVYLDAGETTVVDIQIDGSTRPVLIKNVQLNPLTGAYLHVDLYQVNLKENVTANVPVELVGEAAAVSQKVGAVLQLIDEVEVEALPTDLPESIQVDVSALAAVGDSITVANMKLPAGVTVLTSAETEIVKIDDLVSKEAEEQAKADEAAAQAQAEAAGAETATTDEAAPAPEPTAEPESN